MKILWLFTICGVLCVLSSTAQNPAKVHPPATQRDQPTGIAWRVTGNWQQNEAERPVRSGDAILPGALLMPLQTEVAHSITLLLPDGQRILYECFTREDCIRGFRIPPLTERPSPFAVHMLKQISEVLVRDRGTAAPSPAAPAEPAHTTVPKRDEALVVIDGAKQVTVGGLLSNMPNGSYTYNLVPTDHGQGARLQVPLRKSTSTCTFPVPSAGLYDVAIWDAQNTPRINLFLAAIDTGQASTFAAYPKARKLMNDWDAQYYGWPVHDLMRAYLEWLLQVAGGSQVDRS